ncbi:MAG: hypothetical protein AAFX50_23435, partial [Acidobacteriota bacterium]
RDPGAFEAGLDRAADATRQLRGELESPADRQSGALDGITLSVRTVAAWLAGLGVVPESVRGAISQVEAAGGAAKISGAGSLRGPGAGSVLIYHPEAATAERLLAEQPGLEPMTLRLGAGGARLDSIPQ